MRTSWEADMYIATDTVQVLHNPVDTIIIYYLLLFSAAQSQQRKGFDHARLSQDARWETIANYSDMTQLGGSCVRGAPAGLAELSLLEVCEREVHS